MRAENCDMENEIVATPLKQKPLKWTTGHRNNFKLQKTSEETFGSICSVEYVCLSWLLSYADSFEYSAAEEGRVCCLNDAVNGKKIWFKQCKRSGH